MSLGASIVQKFTRMLATSWLSVKVIGERNEGNAGNGGRNAGNLNENVGNRGGNVGNQTGNLWNRGENAGNRIETEKTK